MRILNILSCLLLLFSGFLKGAEVCPSSDTENLLHPGKDYLYKFESVALAEAVGTTNDKSKISIKCDAALSHASKCFYRLQLNNCIVNADGGPPGSETAWVAEQPFPDLSKFPILFSLVNGQVSEVYTHEQDPIHFVNIKKGVLSAFVFKLSYTTDAFQEMHTDIHGTCPLTSTPINDTKGSVKTSKDMLHCAFPSRKDWQFSPYSLFWNMSFIQNVINSTTDCEYDINVDEKRLNKVFCKERHAIMLESSAQTAVAVQSNIHYTMTYVNSGPQTEKKDVSSITRKTDIRFEYERTPDPQSNPENFLPKAKKMFADLVEQSTNEIRLLTIPQFTNFVAWIRSASNLIPFLEIVKSCSYLTETENCSPLVKELGMTYLKDALIQCNTLPCIEAVSHLVKNKDISPEYFSYYSWSRMHFSKPAILKHVMSICRDTGSDLCWTSFGNLVRKIYLKQQNAGEDNKLLQDIAKYFHNNIERLCISVDSNLESYSHLLRDLKTIKNMDRIYLLLIPEGSQVLTNCILKPNIPEFVKTFVLETLQAVSPCQDNSSCETLYHKLLPILQNPNVSTTLRALAYENIIQTPQNYGFETELFEILKTDKNMQLKSYIASNLKSLFQDGHFTLKDENYRFMRSMNYLLSDNDMSLNEIVHHPEARSISEVNTQSMNLPFLPEEMQKFSYKIIHSKIYESFDVIPRYFHNDLVVEIFGELVRVFRSGGYSESLENAAIIFERFTKNYNSELPSFKKLLGALKEIVKEFKPEREHPSESRGEYSFPENIIKNVQKLEEMYRKYKPKNKSFFKFFSDIFGSPSGYFSSQDFATSLSELLEMHTLLENLERGVTYNVTKIIRVIEAYHQVPTMMGLPLNWATNATLAFSLRSALKMKLNAEESAFNSEGVFQPSAALTFVNQMVIDFPTVTKIGVQANSSGYSSTQWKVKLEYSKEKKAFRFYKPTKQQKVLELFRTNQLIKHNTYQEIEDWDIERTSSSTCTKEEMSSLLGLEICISKSYPVVTKRVKPWALMSGWCKWQLLINPYDKNLVSYDIETVMPSESKSKELVIRFSTPGSEKKREILFKADVDKYKEDIKLQVIVPELPDFNFIYSQNIPLENSKGKKQRYMVILKLNKDSEYQLMYNDEAKEEEKSEKNYAVTNESPKEEVISFSNFEQFLSINTPTSIYRYSREHYSKGDDEHIKVLLLYENKDPSVKWLHKILPPSMWETDTKSWVEMRIDWKGEETETQASTRQTLISIRDPQTSTDFVANYFDVMERQQITINVTKTHISDGKLLGFANFTFNYFLIDDVTHAHFMDRQIHNVNLTISRKSWAFQIESIREIDKILLFDITLKRSTMVPKNGEISDYNNFETLLTIVSRFIGHVVNEIVEDTSPEYKYESCNFTHPLLLINVTADWLRTVGDHKKKVQFTCTETDCQSTELYLEFLHDGKISAKLILPNDENRKLYLERTLNSRGKHLNLKMNYADDLMDESKEILLKGEILKSNYHVWNLKSNVDTYSRIKSLFENAYEAVASRTSKIAKDPKHPLNRILEPYLQESLYDYYQDFRKQRDEFLLISWKSFEETIITLRPFYEVPVTLLNNIVSSGKAISLEMYNSIKDRSITVWAINYFNLPSYFYKTVTNVQGNIHKIMDMLTPDDKIIRYEFVTGKFIKIYSFRELPTITLEDIWKNPFSKEDEDEAIPQHHHSLGSNKMAMIFGPHQVYTFDEHLYDSAEYSSNCTFLLAHDLRKSTFTVLSDEKTIHVLFPEMTVSVNSENVVFINGSDTPSTLPVEANNGRVVVRRSDVVEIWSPTLRVICSAKDFLCILELNTWHNGETFGLLGNADGLWNNEFSLPNSKTASDVLEFVTNYEVSGKPECKNLKLRNKSPHTSKAVNICFSTFLSLCRFNDSILESFLETCRSNFEIYENACYSSAAYSALCSYKNLQSLTDCNGEKQEDRRIGKKLEVVFIVHEHRSFIAGDKKYSIYKALEKMLTVLNDKFVSNGYSSVLFSLIGFGGKDIRYKPTVHAKERSSWIPLSTIFDMLKHLQFNGDKDVDILNVLRFAAEVKGYNTFHSKIFIVLTTEDKKSKYKKKINSLHNFLNKNGITLYTFASYPSIEKGNKVFGIRADGLILPSPKKNGTASLDYPPGDLAKITSGTHGSLFLKKFIFSDHQPLFFREFAEEVLSKVHKEAQKCRECLSVRSGWWWLVNECTIVYC
ncbi:apolipoprotein B-100 [Nephila pilipes]|uniref:Apolipoprotein B-100 n=1 Tax=Nephila pilipes TaxID=299642 RepID=A0A8X6IHS7_NEPPI|nr:apolipoprotein B-100 [Nephila pilipes]